MFAINNATTPLSQLQVEGNSTSLGEVMRTIGVYNNSSYWRMMTYNSGGNPVEYGTVFHDNNDNDFSMQASVAGLRFYTNGIGNLRMIITSAGKVGIGNAITTPAKMLEIQDPSGGDQLRLSYNSTYRTDFQTTSAGYLNINPNGTRTGLNLNSGSPTAVLDVNGATSTLDPLRLRDLNTGSQTDFLVVDNNGYVKKRSITNAATTCGGSISGYYGLFNSATNLCTGQLYSNGQGYLGIDYTGASGWSGKLDFRVQSGWSGSANAMYIENAKSLGISLYANSTNSNSTGVYSLAGSRALSGIASGFGAGGGAFLAGVYGLGNGTNNNVSDNAGVIGEVNASQANSINYGVYGYAYFNASGTTNIGVYGTAAQGATNYAGYFAGDLYASTYLNLPSDALLKTNVESFSDALTKIEKLNPVTFNYLTDQYPQMHLPEGVQIGFVADEVETVYPELISKIVVPSVFDADGNQTATELTFKTYKPGELMAVAIEGIKELKALSDAQQEQINGLQSQLDACGCGCQMRLQDQGNNPLQSIKIISESVAQLGDCVPNPNGGKTKITVKVPQGIGNAEIVFTDQLGKEVSRIAITNRGYSDLEIETTELENGIYHFSLVVDGKLIDTKQMLVQK